MNLLSDVITYVRRIIKSPSNALITDNLIIDYINRFWIMDMDARIQLFDLKTKYQFQTAPGIDQYNMPLYSLQTEPGSQSVSYYPVYQGFMSPSFINGISVSFFTEKSSFLNVWPNVVQQMQVVATGDGTATYSFTFPLSPNNATPLNVPFEYLLRGHVDINGVIALASSAFGSLSDPPIVTNTQAIGSSGSIASVPVANAIPAVYITANGTDGSSIVVTDSGQFLSGNQNYGLLMQQGSNPNGNTALSGGYPHSFSITGATQANPCVLTATTDFVAGQSVLITGVAGMTSLNNNVYTITSVGATTITINVDSSIFNAYTSGGTATNLINVINYYTGQVYVTFPVSVPSGVAINAQCYLYQTGLPRGILFNNNVLTLRSPPDRQYLVEIDAYLSPAAFLSTSASMPFAYMSEYIARGAARKILSDTGDIEQFQFYEPLFREQELLVWKRSQRQFTATRTQTIYSQGNNGSVSAFGSTVL